MKKIAIIDYQVGNLHSVINAFKQVNQDYQILVSSNLADLKTADKLVLPGVGSFKYCADCLRKIKGLQSTLQDLILEKKIPVLGICVGMQLMFKQSPEEQVTPGLGFFAQSIDCFSNYAACQNLKIPHMGWNQLEFIDNENLLIKGLKNKTYVYFANSYFAAKSKNTVAASDYGLSFSAIVAKNNIYAVQFHPEKSDQAGLKILENFLAI